MLRILIVLLVFLVSCQKESVSPDVCLGGECNATFVLDYPLDKNGYYHVKLDYTQKYFPRFNVEIVADSTEPYWWYNGTPVVQANFDTDTYWQFQNDYIPIVQGNRVYLSKSQDGKMYGKRIVGPVPPQFKGDTIVISPSCFWDAGMDFVKKQYSLKIILE